MVKKTALLLLFLLVLMLMTSCSDKEDLAQSTSERADIALTTPQALPEVGNEDPQVCLSYMLESNTQDTIVIPSVSFVSGTLLTINESHLYRCRVSSLLPASEIASAASGVKGQNLVRLYGNKSQNYLLSSSLIFLKEDVLQPWEDLIAAFVSDTGKKTVQVVSAYGYSGQESLSSSFVTGYSVAINLYENGANYSLASAEKRITVNGKTMTCLDWFQDNCAQYGFVYTGLDGDQAKTLATFRYVGVPHALVMQKRDFVETQEYTRFLRSQSQTYMVNDDANGVTWNIDFCPVDQKEALTRITIPKGAVYTVSGNNVDGFIMAYYMPES